MTATTFALVRWAGRDKKCDAVTSADQADKKAGAAAPSIDQTKTIAEDGFMNGLPTLMNYALPGQYIFAGVG